MNFKNIIHRLNHRSLPKNLHFFKIILVSVSCFMIIFSVKTIFAATETKTTGVPGIITQEMKEALVKKQKALEDKNINSENWVKESAASNGLIIINTLGGSDTAKMVSANSWIPDGIIGATNNTIASLYKPPISGVEYIADSINSFLGKPAYADDGFAQLKGIQSLWKICRNTVYSIISIIFVIMGLLIMLRVKISPQATITIQNSIPKIITTLILVTFSYAICGLIIDISYLVQAVLLSMLQQGMSNSPIKSVLNNGHYKISDLIKGSFDVFRYLTWDNLMDSTTGGTVLISVLAGMVGGLIGLMAGWKGALIGLILGASIILIFASIQLLKFLFGCAKAYIILILNIIAAPLVIALGAFPNSKIGFSSWFMQTIAYASVFPISLVFLVVLNIIINAVSTTNPIWTPGVFQGELLVNNLKAIFNLAGLMILAKLPTLIPEAIFQIKPSPFGKAVNEGFQKFPGVGLVKGGVGMAKSAVSLAASSYLSRPETIQKIRAHFTRNGQGKATGADANAGTSQQTQNPRTTDGAPE